MITIHHPAWKARQARFLNRCRRESSDLFKIYPRFLERPPCFETPAGADRINCHAFTFSQPRWFAPGASWFPDIPASEHWNAWRPTLRRMGWKPVTRRAFRAGYETIAIYATKAGYVTHSARLLQNGLAESKLGSGPIVRNHGVMDIADWLYGTPRYFVTRRIAA